MSKAEIIKTIGGAAVAFAIGYFLLGVYGASIGSDDDCTRNVGAAVRLVLGTDRGGAAAR